MRKGYLFGMVLLATALLAGCALAPKAKVEAAGPPSLTVSSNTVDFGNVSVGGKKTVSLAVSNGADNSASATVSQISITGKGFTLSTKPALPAAVASGQSVTIGITYTPSASGSSSGTLTIGSDASNSSISIPLSGDGTTTADAQLSVSPSNISFGSVAVGNSVTKTGTLTASNAKVTVSTVDESGEGYSLSGITFPLTLDAGKSVSFAVTFAPQAAGSSPGSLGFVSSVSADPNATLSGTGTQASSHTVSLSWIASSSSSVVGYNIYRGTSSGGPYSTKLTSSPQPDTSFVDDSVQSSSTYYYVATAVDSDSGESVRSNQAKAVIP